MSNKKPKYRVKPIIGNKGEYYHFTKLYVIQKRNWFGWFDISNPVINEEYAQSFCEKLNNIVK